MSFDANTGRVCEDEGEDEGDADAGVSGRSVRGLLSRGARSLAGALALAALGVSTLHCGSTADGSVFCGGGPCEVVCDSGACGEQASHPQPPLPLPPPPDASSGPDSVCASIDVALEKVVPTVVLVVDQSSSMEYDLSGTKLLPPGDPGSRWAKVRESLMDPAAGIVRKYEADVEFGLALYSANNGNEKPPAVATCPLMKTVAFARGNYAAMNDLYRAELPVDDTPTADAVLAAAGLRADGALVNGGLAAARTGRPKVLVLATDGEPGRCGSYDTLEQTGAPEARQAVVDAVKAAYRAGITTHVLSVGSALSEAHQQEVANAGLGYFEGSGVKPPPGTQAPLVRPSGEAELAAAFDRIIYGVRSCTFALDGAIVAGSEGRGDVTLNGAPLTFGSPDGYRVLSESAIELVGAACTTLKATDAKVRVRFPCGAFAAVPH